MKNKDFYRQPQSVVNDKRFQTCIEYANFISQFFEEKGIANWELAGVKTRFPIDEKFCDAVQKLEEKSVDNVMNFNSSRPLGEDKINPDHYKVGGIETFDILRAKLTRQELEGFCKGNVIKYITRADHKDKITDIRKAKWYLDKLVEELEKSPKEKPGGITWVDKKTIW